MRVFCTSGQNGYAAAVNESMFGKTEVVKSPYDADLVIFTGGADVSPELYGAEKDRRTGSNPERDKYEQDLYKRVLNFGAPMVGICRGCQFLAVMLGEKLFQHLDSHPSYHHQCKVEGINGASNNIETNSYHHQAVSTAKNIKVLARCREDDRIEAWIGKNNPTIAGVQWHPESMPATMSGAMFFNFIVTLITKSKFNK